MLERWKTFIRLVGYVFALWAGLWLGFNVAVPLIAEVFHWASGVAGIETYMWFDIWDVDTYQSILIITTLLSAIIMVATYQSLSKKKLEKQERLLLLWTLYLAEKHNFEPPDEEKAPWKEDFERFVKDTNEMLEFMARIEHLRPSSLGVQEGN